MGSSSTAVVERLKAQIQTLKAQPRQVLMGLRTGVSEVDELGVFRLGTGVELCGAEASGRTTLALSVVAAACREKRLAAWIDGPGELYPPAAESLGVELSRLLIVRPRAPGQLVWAAVQLLRSGAVCCVVLDVTRTGLVPSLTDSKKLLDAARAGGSLLVLITSQAAPAAGLVRLTMAPAGPRGTARGHLRTVEGDDLPGPRYDIEAPHGRAAHLVRSRLSRQPEVPVRRAARIAEPPHRLAPQPALAYQRPRKNLLRDGKGFYGGTRPGREGPLTLPAPLTRGGR